MSRCTACLRREATPGRRSCARCRERQSQLQRERREQRRRAGLCLNCGRRPEPGRRQCAWCLETARLRRVAGADRPSRSHDEQVRAATRRRQERLAGLRDSGRCPNHAGERLRPGQRLCERCRAKARERNRRRRERLRAERRCFVCGGALDREGTHCAACLRDRRAAQRAKRSA